MITPSKIPILDLASVYLMLKLWNITIWGLPQCQIPELPFFSNGLLPPSTPLNLTLMGLALETLRGRIRGVIRNSRGDWVVGFSKSFTYATNNLMELMALKEVLNLALQQNFKPLEVCVDSMEILRMLQHGNLLYDPVFNEGRSDEEVVDQKATLEVSCKPKCVRQLKEYQACTKRIEGDETGNKHCTGQYFDYWYCIDKCVSSLVVLFGPSFNLGFTQFESASNKIDIFGFVPGNFDYKEVDFRENRSKYQNDPTIMKKLRDAASDKGKKPAVAISKGKRKEVVKRNPLPKRVKYVIKTVPQHPLRFDISCNRNFAIDVEYFVEGMPHVLNIWIYECCSEVDKDIVYRIGDCILRICNWFVVGTKPKFEKFMNGMFSKVVIDIDGSNRDVEKNEKDGDDLKTSNEQPKDIPKKDDDENVVSAGDHKWDEKSSTESSLQFNFTDPAILRETIEVQNVHKESGTEVKNAAFQNFIDNRIAEISSPVIESTNEISTDAFHESIDNIMAEIFTPVVAMKRKFVSPKETNDSECHIHDSQFPSDLPEADIENRSKHRNDPVTMKKLRDKAASKSKKSTSKASKKKFDDSGRPRLRKGMKYRIDKVSPHPLHMGSLCNCAFGEEIKEYFGEDVLGAFRNTIFGIFLDLPWCNWIGQISKCLVMLEIQQDNKEELHVWVQGEILKFTMLEFSIIRGLKCNGNIDDYMYTSSSKSTLMSSTIPPRKILIKAGFESPDQPLKKRNTVMFEQDNQVVMDNDTSGCGHAVHHGSDLYREIHKDATDKREIDKFAEKMAELVTLISKIPAEIVKALKNEENKQSQEDKIDEQQQSQEDGSNKKERQHKSDMKDVNLTAKEDITEVKLKNQESTDVTDVQDAVDFDKKEKLKYTFDGYTINQDLPNELMIDYSQWIVVGLLKTHSIKKETENHYRVNASGLGYRQLNFIVVYPQSKNWFYLMSESKTCWNNEHLDMIFYHLRKKSKIQLCDNYRYTTTSCFFKTYVKKTHTHYYPAELAVDLSTQQDYAESIVVAKNEDAIANIIQGFCMPAGLPWKKEPLIEIQKLAVILPTYLSDNGFYDKTERTDWPSLKAYKGKINQQTGLINKIPFDVDYVQNIPQQAYDSLDCGVFVCAYAEILSEGLQVHSCGFDAASQRARYASLLWHYGVEKANERYTSDNGDPP
ncbi:hypothetical protein FXO38_04889 [Capsicum annuum]|nr:hypothetical protein FXO38_04889 [Capsicum annuum]